MNLLSFQTTTPTIVFAKDFWIFIAIAVPLTLLTLGIWFLATHLEKRTKRKAMGKEKSIHIYEEI